ncbi:MAG: glycoside hydrolase family 3 C-terminal domain-containing protein [Flavobacteriaceae bacterium]|nr:glycoside hydrolase family 3 C-terminal domain-containing protein [Flavobacteriaceae bacterium]
MKKTLKILGYALGGLAVIALIAGIFLTIKWRRAANANMKLLGDPAPTLVQNGYQYRDLNKNGQLDVYEDSRKPIQDRINDLTRQMNLEEKAGLMFITMAGMNKDGSLQEKPVPGEPITFFLETNSTMIAKKKMNHFNIIQSTTPRAMATWNNTIQKLAERTRLGIPITIATDPRHSAHENAGASIPTDFFSKWCSPLGFAAIGDTILMREFGDIARQEYKALGIRLALSPMADLATEPRWGRINGTFGEDAALSARMTKAYVLGFQGDSLTNTSVACMTKHFSGGGPQEDGEDAHFPYGKNQVYPGNNFDYHIIPFEEGAFPARTAQIMPYYGIPVGQTNEEVGFGYNKEIITGLLREKYGFDGVVCSDWGLVSDSPVKPAAAHGVEHLSAVERAAKILDAGCDMFGGEASPQWIVELVQSGKIAEEKIDVSVKRILRDKFRLGLFDDPYVDVDNSAVYENEVFRQKGREAQRRSMVLLKNDNNILPLKEGVKLYVEGINEETAAQFSTLVSDVSEADYVILKLRTPYDPRDQYMLEQFFNQGRLTFSEEEVSKYVGLMQTKPTITVMNLERPAVIPEINGATQGLIADFDSSDEVIMELIFGQFKPSGKMPFELPSSVEAVEAQKEDVPYDSKDPLYPFGYGISF